MSELDKLKETITQLRLWLGIAVVTDISLIGWAAANYGPAKNLLIILASNLIIVLTVFTSDFNKKIRVAIKSLRDL